MKPHMINQLAIWLPMKKNEIDVKAFNEGYPYKSGDIILRSNLINPIYRYAKNYTKHKKKFSLCFITQENNIKLVEKWLDSQVDNIKKEDIIGGFKLLDIYYGGNK